MKRLLSLTALLLCLPAVSFTQTTAPVPSFMSFQGRLAKPDGTPVPDTTSQTLTFSLYDAATGGNLLWTQISNNVAVHNGTFATKLDFSTGFASGKTFNAVFGTAAKTPYLQIKVGTDAPLTPRQPFASNAFAFTANTALTVPDGSLTAAKFASGVFTFSNLSGTLNGSQIADASITTAKLAAGANTPGGAAGGDLTGTYPNPSLITSSSLLPKVSGGVMNVGAGTGVFIDQSQTQADFFGTSSQDYPQSFTPSQTETMTGIDLIIGTNSGAAGQATLSILAGEVTGGTPLYSTTITFPGSLSFQHFDLPGTPPVLQANQLYTFLVHSTNGGTLQMYFQDTDVYPRGQFFYYPHSDLYFQTYARPVNGVTVNGSLSVANIASAQSFSSITTGPAQTSLLLAGSEFPNTSVSDNTSGIAFLLGVNRANDRQLWIADSGNLTQNGTNPTIRIWPNNKGIDAVSTDGNTLLNLTLEGNGGNLGVGTFNPAYKLDVNGQVRANNVSVSSDARWKTNIHPLDNALGDVLSLRGVTYDWDREQWPGKNFPEGRQIGFIAQEVEKVFPELVLTDSEGYKSVLYQNAVPILVEAIKQQQNQIEILQAQVKETDVLKKQLAEVLARLGQIEAAQKAGQMPQK